MIKINMFSNVYGINELKNTNFIEYKNINCGW